MFTVYRVKHISSGKPYIGVHKTSNPNDSYFGSGLAIRAAIKLHGKGSFVKEVLFVFSTAAEAYAKEIELTADFSSRDTYNMRRGGLGGFTREAAKRGNEASRLVGAGPKGGQAARDQGVGVHGASTEERAAWGRLGGLAIKGRELSAAHKAALSSSLMGHVVPEEIREKIRLSHTGKKLTDEHKAHVGDAMRASWARRRSRKAETSCS